MKISVSMAVSYAAAAAAAVVFCPYGRFHLH